MYSDKYKRRGQFVMENRSWPGKQIIHAPCWCSVDLRDGNQALPAPMSVEAKKDMFRLLCAIGFRHIEVGFPSSSETEYAFVRSLIKEKMIPDDVAIQVLSPCRSMLIQRTMASLEGAKQAIFHLYCGTSPIHRDIVFRMDRENVKRMVLSGVKDVIYMSRDLDTELSLEFSPEHFNETEMDYALEICEDIAQLWLPERKGALIFNLPATVECSSPNVFADQVEWFCSRLSCRKDVSVSVHAHNDRGCGVAATELSLLAGADRVEGTLFGNGERTGNADIICLAGNMLVDGIDPGLDLSNMPKLCKLYEDYTGMIVHDRSPYAGRLVFTAFSGSHQDAISKGKQALRTENVWRVPYLLADPADFGRAYEPVVRINSQSGKGGLDYILHSNYGIKLPHDMLEDFMPEVKAQSQRLGELLPEQIFSMFERKYCLNQKKVLFSSVRQEAGMLHVRLLIDGAQRELQIPQEGSAAYLCDIINREFGISARPERVETYLLGGVCGRSISLAAVKNSADELFFGASVGMDSCAAEISALVSALNNLLGV